MVGGERVGGGNMAAGVALAAPARRLGLGLCVGSELNTPLQRGEAGPGSRTTAKWPWSLRNQDTWV